MSSFSRSFIFPALWCFSHTRTDGNSRYLLPSCFPAHIVLNAVFSTFRLSFSQKHIFSFSVEEDCEEEKKSDEKYVDCRGKIKWTGYQLLPDIYGEAILCLPVSPLLAAYRKVNEYGGYGRSTVVKLSFCTSVALAPKKPLVSLTSLVTEIFLQLCGPTDLSCCQVSVLNPRRLQFLVTDVTDRR